MAYESIPKRTYPWVFIHSTTPLICSGSYTNIDVTEHYQPQNRGGEWPDNFRFVNGNVLELVEPGVYSLGFEINTDGPPPADAEFIVSISGQPNQNTFTTKRLGNQMMGGGTWVQWEALVSIIYAPTTVDIHCKTLTTPLTITYASVEAMKVG